jgi:hypothetical protein
MKTIPEPNAELMSLEDVHEDVSSLTAALERRRAEKRAYKILEKPSVKKALDKLISSGICENEEEAIEKALKTLITAITH